MNDEIKCLNPKAKFYFVCFEDAAQYSCRVPPFLAI